MPQVYLNRSGGCICLQNLCTYAYLSSFSLHHPHRFLNPSTIDWIYRGTQLFRDQETSVGGKTLLLLQHRRQLR